MPRMRLIIVLAVVVGAFAALAPSASAASLGRFINEGLSNKASTATNRVKQLVEVNPKVAKAVAADMGVSPGSVDWNSAKATSKGTCKGYNTGQGAGGSVHTTTYGTFSCWRFSVEVNGSSRIFNMKSDCSNALLKHRFAPRPHARIIKKTMRFTVKKPFVLRVQHVCPSGQQVTVTVSGTVRATVKGRAWGKIWGAYTLKFKQQVKIAIDGKIAVECQGTPPPPPHDACVNIEGNQNSIPNGMILVAGNCVTQTITCGTGWYWSDVYVNCIQVVCGVVIVGDNNNVNIGDICSTSPPPPPTTPSVLITSVIDLNDVPAGLNSGPMPFTVYASAPGARVTVDPGIGKISTCNSSTPLATVTITGLQAGDNNLCVIFYAPTDAAATQATITYTATLTGATPAVRQVTFAITHPTRP